MIVGICKLDLQISGCRSLKDKRRVLRKIKDRTESRFKIVVAEVEHQDLWQRAGLGFAVVGNEHAVVEGIVERVINSIADMGDSLLIDRYTEMMSV